MESRCPLCSEHLAHCNFGRCALIVQKQRRGQLADVPLRPRPLSSRSTERHHPARLFLYLTEPSELARSLLCSAERTKAANFIHTPRNTLPCSLKSHHHSRWKRRHLRTPPGGTPWTLTHPLRLGWAISQNSPVTVLLSLRSPLPLLYRQSRRQLCPRSLPRP